MYKVLLMSGNFYAKEIDLTDEQDIETIEQFSIEGTPVIIVNELGDLTEIGIDPDDVEIIPNV